MEIAIYKLVLQRYMPQETQYDESQACIVYFKSMKATVDALPYYIDGVIENLKKDDASFEVITIPIKYKQVLLSFKTRKKFVKILTLKDFQKGKLGIRIEITRETLFTKAIDSHQKSIEHSKMVIKYLFQRKCLFN